MSRGEAFITGLGMSEVGVRLNRSPLGLTLDAVREAIADAGLELSQIDGVATYPGKMQMFLGFSPIGADELIEALGLQTRWHIGAAEMTAQLGAIAEAAMAVKTGAARHVRCFRTVYEAAALARPEEFPPLNRSAGVTGNSQWVSPFGAFSAANWTAQFATRHMRRYGLTREQLAQVVLNDHANAALNPRAIVKKPLMLDEYMAARMISTPFCLYDCDRFTDCSTVVIVSAGEALDEVKTTPIRIAATRLQWGNDDPTPRWLRALTSSPGNRCTLCALRQEAHAEEVAAIIAGFIGVPVQRETILGIRRAPTHPSTRP